MNTPDTGTLWYPYGLDVYLNRWFPDYGKARDALDKEGGYLFPYKHHFFICREGAVQAMGLDPYDPDWNKIGYDCAKPSDPAAFLRLCEKREMIAV